MASIWLRTLKSYGIPELSIANLETNTGQGDIVHKVIIINADQQIGNYWIRANMSSCSIPRGSPDTINYNTRVFDNMNITGILRYEGAPETIPTSEAYPADLSDCTDHDPTTLNPVSLTPSVPTDYAKRLLLEISVRANPVLVALINNSSMVMDFYHPSNEKVIEGAGFVTSDNAYSYDVPNQPVEIILNNTERRTHPFHLASEEGSYSQPLSSLKYDFNNPVFRDTLTLKEQSLTAIRYYADNPGVWLIHCHIEWHVEMGMVAQLIESPSEFKKLTIPKDVLELCNVKDEENS
ncbi:12168_t:CDS:2 [Acaulospora colombiana]|uniref:12168_t:CDS:1 n=1 Tax=Acaulospora colombiana TaxID=27376 RepID=A0ACA9MB52_9GLOM|nr:12168_t:CDS:2 [Acaulospora colombiana]